jgi:hypothetical protein
MEPSFLEILSDLILDPAFKTCVVFAVWQFLSFIFL